MADSQKGPDSKKKLGTTILKQAKRTRKDTKAGEHGNRPKPDRDEVMDKAERIRDTD